MENPIEINERIIIQQWEGYKRMHPEFQTRNKRKGKEIIYNPSNKQKTVQILDKSNAQILVDLTKDNKNQNGKIFKKKFNFNANLIRTLLLIIIIFKKNAIKNWSILQKII